MSTNKTIKIAIADDHRLFREGIAGILGNYPALEIIILAANGQELLDKLADANLEKPHVCIIDINMPVLNGYDTVKTVKERYPKILTLALSMYDNEDNILKMLRCGANGYVLKDTEPAQLVNAIHDVCEYGFYHSELITNKLLTSLQNVKEADTTYLSEKELTFLKYACTEMTYKEIALQMEVAERTADGYRDRLFEKLGVKSRTGLVIYALRNGIVDIY